MSSEQLTVSDGKLLARCERAMVLAIRHHFELPHGTGRATALTQAAEYAAVIAALRSIAKGNPHAR